MEVQMGNSFLFHQTFLMVAATESSPEPQITGEAGSALQSQQWPMWSLKPDIMKNFTTKMK